MAGCISRQPPTRPRGALGSCAQRAGHGEGLWRHYTSPPSAGPETGRDVPAGSGQDARTLQPLWAAVRGAPGRRLHTSQGRRGARLPPSDGQDKLITARSGRQEAALQQRRVRGNPGGNAWLSPSAKPGERVLPGGKDRLRLGVEHDTHSERCGEGLN